MRALVTGGDGFVGQHLLRALLAEGADVVASVLRLPPRAALLTRAEAAAIDWSEADIRDEGMLFDLVDSSRAERIFHLAGFSSGAAARLTPGEALALNAGGTLNLCQAVARVRDGSPSYSPRLLVMGSGEAYGSPPSGPLTEETELRPRSPYGLSKACQEAVAHSFRRWQRLDTVVARAFNLVGPGQSWHFAVPDFSRQVAAIAAGEADPVLEVGNLQTERDFTDVRDAVRGLLLIAGKGMRHRAYNVCSGQSVPIGSLVEWILDEAGVEIEVRVVEERLRPEEVPRVVGDPGRLRCETGWEAEREIRESVREVYRWARDTAERTRSGMGD